MRTTDSFSCCPPAPHTYSCSVRLLCIRLGYSMPASQLIKAFYTFRVRKFAIQSVRVRIWPFLFSFSIRDFLQKTFTQNACVQWNRTANSITQRTFWFRFIGFVVRSLLNQFLVYNIQTLAASVFLVWFFLFGLIAARFFTNLSLFRSALCSSSSSIIDWKESRK